MALPAIRKIIAAERPFIIVTGRATFSASRREMLVRNRRYDLSLLRGTGSYAMTIGATQSLSLMSGVAEVDFEGFSPLGGTAKAAGFVAGAA